MTWTSDALENVATDPAAIHRLFPAARREARAEGVDGDELRVALLGALQVSGAELATILEDLYRHGDAGEKRAVLTALADLEPQLGAAALPVVQDALRSNDSRLVETALGEYAARHLDDPSWRQGVVKCVFLGISLTGVAGLDRRVDVELHRMLGDYAAERIAAGRPVPVDAQRVLALPVRNT